MAFADKYTDLSEDNAFGPQCNNGIDVDLPRQMRLGLGWGYGPAPGESSEWFGKQLVLQNKGLYGADSSYAFRWGMANDVYENVGLSGVYQTDGSSNWQYKVQNGKNISNSITWFSSASSVNHESAVSYDDAYATKSSSSKWGYWVTYAKGGMNKKWSGVWDTYTDVSGAYGLIGHNICIVKGMTYKTVTLQSKIAFWTIPGGSSEHWMVKSGENRGYGVDHYMLNTGATFESWSDKIEYTGTALNTTRTAAGAPSDLLYNSTITGLKGCHQFKIASRYRIYQVGANGYGASRYCGDVVFTTPPAPLTSKTCTGQTFSSDGSKVIATIKVKTDGTNNESGAPIKIEYRVGDTTDTWQALASAVTAGDEATFNVELTPGETSTIWFRQYRDGVLTTADMSGSTQCVNDTTKNLQISTRQSLSVTAMSFPKPTLGDYSWDDLRKTVTVSGKVSTSDNTGVKILWGYTSSTVRTAATAEAGSTSITASLTNLDLTKPYIYVKTVAYTGADASVESDILRIDIPHPILGVATDEDGNQRYITDIVEKKENGTVTPKWKNGQRVVKTVG